MSKTYLKIILLVSVLSALLFLVSCGEEPTITKDTTYYQLFGPVKSSLTYFDYSNSPKSKKETHKQKSIKLFFNQNGRFEKIIDKRFVGKPSEDNVRKDVHNFIYDDHGRLEKQIMEFNGDETQTITYLYREKAIMPYASTTAGNETRSSFSKFEHDENGNLISSKTMDYDLDPSWQYSAKYNIKNQRVEHTTLSGKRYKSQTTIKYNSKGFITSETTISKTALKDNDKSVLTYEYLKTDAQGNWIERKVLSENDEGYVIEKREINYF